MNKTADFEPLMRKINNSGSPVFQPKNRFFQRRVCEISSGMTGYPPRPLQDSAAGTCNPCLSPSAFPDMNPSPAASSAEPPAVLGRHALNLPNLITGTRLLLAFGLFAMIALTSQWIPAAILFIFAASTDALDGYIARRNKQITVLGRILDPFVDKVIVCGTFVFLLEHQTLPDSGVRAWMVIIIIGREMFVSSLRGILEKEGKDFSASFIGKLKMVLQCVAVSVSLLSMAPLLQFTWTAMFRDATLYLAVAATLYSGAVYVSRGFSLLRDT